MDLLKEGSESVGGETSWTIVGPCSSDKEPCYAEIAEYGIVVGKGFEDITGSWIGDSKACSGTVIGSEPEQAVGIACGIVTGSRNVELGWVATGGQRWGSEIVECGE